MQTDKQPGEPLEPHEAPPGAADEEPKGTPNADRHQTETAHDQGDGPSKS